MKQKQTIGKQVEAKAQASAGGIHTKEDMGIFF